MTSLTVGKTFKDLQRAREGSAYVCKDERDDVHIVHMKIRVVTYRVLP